MNSQIEFSGFENGPEEEDGIALIDDQERVEIKQTFALASLLHERGMEQCGYHSIDFRVHKSIGSFDCIRFTFCANRTYIMSIHQ